MIKVLEGYALKENALKIILPSGRENCLRQVLIFDISLTWTLL